MTNNIKYIVDALMKNIIFILRKYVFTYVLKIQKNISYEHKGFQEYFFFGFTKKKFNGPVIISVPGLAKPLTSDGYS